MWCSSGSPENRGQTPIDSGARLRVMVRWPVDGAGVERRNRQQASPYRGGLVQTVGCARM
jgi:hypothetical protein